MYKSFQHYLQTRTAYIVIAVVGMIVSLLNYAVNISNINNMKYFRKLKVDWLVKDLNYFIYFCSICLFNKIYLKKFLGLDVVFMLMMFAISVAATVREAQLRTYDKFLIRLYFNIGAFASAAVSQYFF